METLIIIGSILSAGLFLNGKNPRESLSNTEDYNTNNKSEIPNSMNIYNSNYVDAANNEIFKKSTANYKQSENPSTTGVLPPIYNSYSIGNNTQQFKTTNAELTNAYNTNLLTNVKAVEEPVVTERPMFTALHNLESKEHTVNFSNFGNEPINTSVSLLTGLPIKTHHNNEQPFFGGSSKQNIEAFTNTSILDTYTGNTSTYQHKQEQPKENYSPQFAQDIRGVNLMENIDLSRYIPSSFKTSEKPFYEEQVSAPISNTLDNPISNAASNYKTIDELRSGNKPQISYGGVMKSGQYGNVRGIQSKVSKNKVETTFDGRLLSTTGAYTGSVAKDNFSQIQSTNRQSQNQEYYGTARDNNVKSEPRYCVESSDSNCVLVQPNKRQPLKSDTTRNKNVGFNPNSDDYGKSGIDLPDLERNTTNVSHSVNIHKENSGQMNYIQDDIKNTMKETVLSQDNSGNLKSTKINSANTGYTDYDLKTTQKETLIENKYKGQASKKDGLGYIVNKHIAKTTNKEITSDISYSGGIADTRKSQVIYDTYKNPEKVKNAIHTSYQGSAIGFKKDENRELFANAEISDKQEILLKNNRSNGRNSSLNNKMIDKHDTGIQKFTKNMRLKEKRKTRTENLNNISNNIPTKIEIGNVSSKNVPSSIENTRLNGNIIKQQLSRNELYNLR